MKAKFTLFILLLFIFNPLTSKVFAQSATTNAATSVASTTATLNGTVSGGSNNWEDISFRYATATAYSNNSNSLDGIGTLTQADGFSSPGADGAWSLALSGLTEGETYYFRIEATDGSWTAHTGSALSFTTTDPGINVTTDAATSVGANGATLNATFGAGTSTSGGITQQTFEWGETTSYGNSYTFSGGNAIGDCPFTKNHTISGLSPGTTYHFRAYGYSTEYGTYDYGSDLTFTTIDYATATSLTAQNITATSADARGSVTDDGGGTVSERGVVYNTTGTTPTIGEAGNTKAQAASGGTGGFTVSLSSLSSSTTYYYRAYAINEAGTSYGGLQTFDTEVASPEISIEDSDGTNIADGDATPSTTESTDFGSTSTAVSQTYTIKNTGDATLNLTNSPIVYIGGADAEKFSVTTQPASSTVATSGSVTFTVQFDPANETGTFTAEIIIENDDTDENPFNFDVKGVGLKPEINLKGNGNNIPDDDALSNTPTTTNHTDFGTIYLGNTLTRTFTIENLGNSTLTLDGASPYVSVAGTNAGDFSVTVAPSNSIGATNSTTFQVEFTPSATGTRSAYISIGSNDADEDPYTFNIEGTGAVSSNSDIIANSSFSYPANIAYTDYDGVADITTGNALKVAEFIIRDGGGAADDDNLATILNSITLSISNYGNIDRLALYDGITELSETGTVGSSVTFSSLASNPSASDGGTKTIAVYATFNTTVTDNQQIKFTVSGASVASSSSGFANSDAGGAFTSVDGDDNRIEVTATSLSFNTLSNASVGVALSPQPEVTAVDANGNKDLDFNSVVTLSATGGQNVSGNTATASSGVALYSTFTVEETATTTITASGGSISGTSNSITVSASGASTIISAANESTNIDYISYDASTITSTSDALRVWSFTIQDGGATNDDSDGSATIVDYLKLTKGAGNSISDWSSAIKNAAIFDGTTKVGESSTIHTDYIEFSNFSSNLTAADDANKTYDLYLTFNASQTDNSIFQFLIDVSTDVTVTGSSSGIDGASSDAQSATGSAKNQIEVTASKLIYTTNPSSEATVSTALATQPELTAYDGNDNIDLDFTSTVTLSNSSSLAMSNNTQAASGGVATFSGFAFDATGNDIDLIASATGLTSASFSSIDIGASSTSWSSSASSTDWFTESNWTNGVPVSTTDATILSGTNQPVISATGAVCDNLTINAGATVTVGNGYGLDINGNLAINTPNSSGASGALVDKNTVNFNKITVSGTTSIERYLTSGQWHYFASPFSSSVNITTIFEQAESGDVYAKYYDGVNSVWEYLSPSTTLNLDNGVGYSVWSTNNTTTSFSNSGNPFFSGDKTINVYKNVDNEWGWNLVGNPYPSAVDWDQITKNNVNTTIYYYNGTDYDTYNSSGGIGTPSGTTGTIPPMQGAFIQCSDNAGGSISMDNSMRLGSPDIYYKKTAPADKTTQYIRLQASDEEKTDELIIAFNDNASTVFDDYDSKKYLKTDTAAGFLQIYSLLPDGKDLVINTYPAVNDQLSIPLGIEVDTERSFTFSVNEMKKFDNVSVQLIDHFEDVVIDLNEQATYTVTLDNSTTGRFSILFNDLVTDNKQVEQEEQLKIYSNKNTIYLTSNIQLQKQATVQVFDMLGKLQLSEKVDNLTYHTITTNVKAGIYIVKVNTGDNVYTTKIRLE